MRTIANRGNIASLRRGLRRSGVRLSSGLTRSDSQVAFATDPFDRLRECQGQPVVQKFGGTSLGTAEKLEKVANIVQLGYENAGSACAVVSALSSHTKEEGTTTRLLNAVDAAVIEGKHGFGTFLDAIEATHMECIDGMISAGSARDELRDAVAAELDFQRSFCASLAVIQEVSPRSHDIVVGAGERLSALVVTGVLREKGLPAVCVDLSDAFSREGALDTNLRGFHRLARGAIQSRLAPLIANGELPVVTGYLGNIRNGIIAGIGRGYTDFTAALCAGALGAQSLQVWKESDGVFTGQCTSSKHSRAPPSITVFAVFDLRTTQPSGNPTKIATARLLHRVTAAEAEELTNFGNEVLHPFTMECAIEKKVPISILNTFKLSSPGTTIVDTVPGLENVPSANQIAYSGASHSFGNVVRAVCSKKKIRVLSVKSRRNEVADGSNVDSSIDDSAFLAKVFGLLDSHGVRVDVISTSIANMSIAVHEAVSESALNAFIEEAREFAATELERDCSIVAVVGAKQKHCVGLSAALLTCLAEHGINIVMIAQGSSEINMSVVIAEERMDEAIKAIHARFLESSD